MRLAGKQRKFAIGGAIVALGIAYLVYAGVRDTMVYYMTPAELKAKGAAVVNEGVRMGGKVVDGSVKWDQVLLTLQFVVADEKDPSVRLPVAYRGLVPDAFKEGADVIVEGRLTSEGVFQAKTLLAKCPSKYETES